MENPCFEPAVTDAELAETAALASTIWHECFATLLSPQQLDYMVDTLQSAAAITAYVRQQGFTYYRIFMDGVAAGYVAVQPQDGRLFLSKLYLLARHRGKGLAQKALAFVQGLARQQGCGAIWLTVNKGNARAIAAYQKAGFTTVSAQVADIGGGFVMDDYVMEKQL